MRNRSDLKRGADPGKRMPRHVFAVCAYGESPYLEECLRSLRQQSVKSSIVLCTSTPGAFLREIAQTYDIPLYIREGESSLLADWEFAAETAARETGARLVTIAHQDDRYHRDYTKALLHAARLYPDLSLFCTRYRTIDAEGAVTDGMAERVKRILRLPLRLHGIADRTFIKRLVLRFGNGIGCPTCTYNLDVTALPLFRQNDQFVIDWDTLWRMSGEPGRFVCVEKEMLDYRVHAGAATKRNMENHNREKEETEMFRRIWGDGITGRLMTLLLMHFYKRAYRAYR